MIDECPFRDTKTDCLWKIARCDLVGVTGLTVFSDLWLTLPQAGFEVYPNEFRSECRIQGR